MGKLQLEPPDRKRSILGPLGGWPVIGGFLVLAVLLSLQQCSNKEPVGLKEHLSPQQPVAFASAPYPTLSPKRDTKPTTSDVSAAVAAPADPDALVDQVIIGFGSDADRDEFLRFAAANGLSVVSQIAQLNAALVTGKNVGLVWTWLRSHPKSTVANNYPVYAPPAPKTQRMAGMAAFGKTGPAFLGAPLDRRGLGAGVKVAVLDTRVETHPMLNDTAITRTDLFQFAPIGKVASNEHGTAVAAIIAGRDGMAPDAAILSYNVMSAEGLGDSFSVSRGIIQAVVDGAQVINLSVGGHNYSKLLETAINYAIEHGVAVVASTGNDGTMQVAYPAQYPGVIAVAGVDANGQVPSFSNSGSQVALAAPAVGVTTAGADGQMQSFSGTSAAAPFVSGAIAAVLSENPGLSARQAADLLLTYANDTGAPGLDDDSGAGVIDLERIRRRNDPTFTDVALAGIWLNPEYSKDGTVAVVMTVQNQGNQPLAFTRMEVTVEGHSPRVYQTGSLRPGAVWSETLWLPISAIQQPEGLRLYAQAFSGHAGDSRPANDRGTLRLLLPKKP